MPLRDHFRPPVDNIASWEGFHGGWPMVIVQHLYGLLPDGYVAAPGVHLGTAFEIDVSAYEQEAPTGSPSPGGTAIVPWVAPAPTSTLEADLSDQDEYEVRVNLIGVTDDRPYNEYFLVRRFVSRPNAPGPAQ